MGIADVELVDQRARLVGVDDDHLAGRVGAGENPHSTAHGVCFLELLRLAQRHRRQHTAFILAHKKNPVCFMCS